jgi:hypothetical protein
LANPNGVLIGPGGRVNVGGLVATTGRIDTPEFLNSGKLSIDRVPSARAVQNEGVISIAEGGYAALAAASIKNTGVIIARAGSIALGSGKAMVLDFHGDRLIQFQVTEALDQLPVGSDALVDAEGKMVADGGQVLITARAAKGLIDNAINLKGHVMADRVRVDGGTVILGDGGAVRLSGSIDAGDPQGKGGFVSVLGEAVGMMDGASIDASGANGGGEVLVGGTWQGKGGQNAAFAYVAPTATIKADASEAGDGGKVVVWADDSTRFNGAISARGAGAGAGGQVETSGKRALDVGAAATVNVSGGSAGKSGVWLLDPTDITIAATGAGALTGGVFDPLTSSTISPATITAGLATGDVTIKTSAGAGGAGDISYTNGAIVFNGSTARTLTLVADRNISITGAARISLTGAAHNVTLNSGASGTTQATVSGNIFVNGSTITTQGGVISMVGGAGGALYAEAKGTNDAGVKIQSSVLNAGDGTILVRGIGNQTTGVNNAQGVSITSNSSMTANGGITLRGISGPGAGSTDAIGVSVQVSNLSATGSATGTGGIIIDGESRGAGTNSRAIYLLSGASTSNSILFGADGFTATGVVATGAAGVGLNISGVKVSGTGSVKISANRASSSTAGVMTFSSSGVNSAQIVSTAGSISLTTLESGATNRPAVRVLDGSLIQTTSGDLTIDAQLTQGGLWINGNSQILTSSGHISIISLPGISSDQGAIRIGLRDGSGNTDGTIAATGAGGRITLTGMPRSGLPNLNAISLERGVISTVDQPITIVGDRIGFATTLADLTISSGQKTIFRPYSVATSVGVAGGAGNLQLPDNLLQRVSGAVEIGWSDGTGLITVAANTQLRQNMELITNGGVTSLGPIDGDIAGGRSFTISAQTSTVNFGGSIGATTSLSQLTVTGGAIRTDGAAQFVTKGAQSYAGSLLLSGPATYETTNSDVSFGGSVDGTTVGQMLTSSLGTGTIGFANGAGATTALNSLTVGAARIAGTIATVGAQSYGGLVLLSGPATFETTNSDVSFGGSVDGTTAGQTLTSSLGTGTIVFANGVGATTALNSLTVGAARIAGTIATVGAQSYGRTVSTADATLRTTDALIAFSGPLDGPGAVRLENGTGSTSFGGSVGAVTRLASLTQVGTGQLAARDQVRTVGLQSYVGPVVLGGSTVFDSLNGVIDFSAGLDGSTVGGQSARIDVDGDGKARLPVGAGATTALASLSLYHGPNSTYASAEIGGTVSTIGRQRYDAVTLLSDVTLSTNNAPIYFDYSLDGTNKLLISAGGADVTLPPLFVTPVPIDRVGVGRVYVQSLPSFGTRPSQQSVAAMGTSPSVESQPSRPSGPGSPGDTPVVKATTPTLTSSPTFGSMPSVATSTSQSTVETVKVSPPMLPSPPFVPSLTNRGEPLVNLQPRQGFQGAPSMEMVSRLLKVMSDFEPKEENEVSTLDLSRSALNADTTFDRTDPTQPGPTITFSITSTPLK